MIVTPFETYQHYLSLKNHFTNPKYDFFRYGARTRNTVTSFNKRKDKYWFEKTSRKYNDREVVDFLVSNFVSADNPQSLWIGENYQFWRKDLRRLDAKETEFDLLVQRTKQRIAIESRIGQFIRLHERTSPHLKSIFGRKTNT